MDPQPETERPAAPQLRLLGETVLVAALILVTFAPSLPYHFLPSDYDWLSLARYGDSELRGLQTITAYRPFAGQIFRTAHGVLGDSSALPYRLALLFVHGVNCILVGRLAVRMLGRPSVGWIASAIFAVAPASSEVVHQIASFAYPVMTLGLLTGLLLYDRAIRTGTVWPWVGALFVFGICVPLREHWIVAPFLAACLEFAHGGMRAFRTRGFWARVGAFLFLGLVLLLVRYLFQDRPLVPAGTGVDAVGGWGSIAACFLGTVERLVLPPLPLDPTRHATAIRIVGALLIGGVVFLVARGTPEDRRGGFAAIAALLVSLGPFLLANRTLVRQSHAYLATTFAAALAAFVIVATAERVSTRLTIPIVLAFLAGLLLEQQAEFSRDYKPLAEESLARSVAYRVGQRLGQDADEIVFFAGDLEAREKERPNLQGVRSTFRVLTGVSRRQVVQLDVANEAEFLSQYAVLKSECKARGEHMRIFLRGPRSYELVRFVDNPEPYRVIFATENEGKAVRTIYALLPRDPVQPRVLDSQPANGKR